MSGEWRYMAARVTGSSHLKVGQPCQDRFISTADVADWILIAVSDGAGTASQSDIGAEVATAAAISSMQEAIACGSLDLESGVQEAMRNARRAVVEKAERDEISPREFACTLLLVVIGPAGGAAGQIGDGVICVRPNEDDWSYAFWPQRGEYANVTRFVTDEDASEHWETSELQGRIVEVGVMTDGLEPLALHYATRSVHSPFFEGLIASLRDITSTGEARELSQQLESFLASPRVTDRADDDLTLVLASRVCAIVQ